MNMDIYIHTNTETLHFVASRVTDKVSDRYVRLLNK